MRLVLERLFLFLESLVIRPCEEIKLNLSSSPIDVMVLAHVLIRLRSL